MIRPRAIVLSLALFTALMLLAAWPGPWVQAATVDAYCALVNGLVAPVTFGEGGHVRCTSGRAREVIGLPADAPADAALRLRVDQYDGEVALPLSVRRDGYLPLVLGMATVLAAPIGWRRRVRCLAGVVLGVLGTSLAAAAFLVRWAFMFSLQGIYAPSPSTRQLTHFIFSAFWLPPGNRFLGPVVLGLVLVWWQSSPSAASTPPLSGPKPNPPPADPFPGERSPLSTP